MKSAGINGRSGKSADFSGQFVRHLVERREVASELLPVGAASLEVVVEGDLRLDEADGDAVLGEDDVRRPALDPLWLVRRDDAGGEGLDQRLDGGPVRM